MVFLSFVFVCEKEKGDVGKNGEWEGERTSSVFKSKQIAAVMISEGTELCFIEGKDSQCDGKLSNPEFSFSH